MSKALWKSFALYPARLVSFAQVFPRPRLHRALTLVVLGFCAWLAIRGALKGLRPGGNDFTIYYDSARALLGGRDPILVHGSIYLPSFDVALLPFGVLPYPAALCLWQSLCLLALVWGWRRSLELVGPALNERPYVPWLALLAVARLADSTFAYGQVNTITFALVAEAVYRFRSARLGSTALAIGAGTALKILPGLLCIWLVFRGAWRAAAASIVAIAILTLVPPLVAMGPTRAARSFENWRALVFEPVRSGGEKLLEAREYVPGQSLTAACYRTFSATPATSAGNGGPRANLFDWPLETTHKIVLALGGLHLAIWALTVRRRRESASPAAADARLALEAGLSIAMILLLGPVVQKAHMIWLLLPYAALLGIPTELQGWRRVLRDGLLFGSMALVAGTSPALLGDRLATRLISGNVIFIAAECALGAVLLELWASPQMAPSPG